MSLSMYADTYPSMVHRIVVADLRPHQTFNQPTLTLFLFLLLARGGDLWKLEKKGRLERRLAAPSSPSCA